MKFIPVRRSDGWVFCSTFENGDGHRASWETCQECGAPNLNTESSDHMNAKRGDNGRQQTVILCLSCAARYKELWATGFFGLMEIVGA